MERVECPICGRSIPKSIVNEHANKCLNDTEVDDYDSNNVSTSSECLVPDTKRSKLGTDTPSDVGSVLFPASSVDPRPGSKTAVDLVCPLSAQPGSSDDCKHKSRDIMNSQVTKEPWSFLKGRSSFSPSSSAAGKTVLPSKRTVMGVADDTCRKDSTTSMSTSSACHVTSHCSKLESVISAVHDTEDSLPSVSQHHSDCDRWGTSSKSVESTTRIVDGVPLAEKMRPTSLAGFVGQGQVVGSKKPLRILIESNNMSSLILWGPPGCGKTTLAKIIAQQCRQSAGVRFVTLSATMAGIADVKEAVKVAKNEKMFKRKTILFVDEIHRFNKLQQDAFLPHVEDGTIVLIGATTENPSFHVNNALLSRCQVIVLEKLSECDISTILCRALSELDIPVIDLPDESSLSSVTSQLVIEKRAIETLSALCDGDARTALNSLQVALQAKQAAGAEQATVITEGDIKDSLQHSHILYDRAGEEHYNCASALQKSIRGSDENAAIYWLARMLEGGEDPRFIARRLVQCSSEDIGLADSHALPLAVATFQACHFNGLPECAVNLAHCTTYMARAKKSNETYVALCRARDLIRQQKGPQPGVPLHLRNATTKLAHQLGYGVGYQYNHTVKVVDQVYLPSELQGVNFFRKEETD